MTGERIYRTAGSKVKKKENCAVIVPVHKKWPDEWEKRSFRHLLEVFAQRPVFLVHPQGVSMEKYLEFPGAQDCRAVAFPSSNYISRQTYNDLLLTPAFYSAFMGYEYILVHHPDSWCFKDDLDAFTALGADYIGCAGAGSGGRMAGGLSLRKTYSCLCACRASSTMDGISLLLKARYLSMRDLLTIAKRNMAIPVGAERPYHAEDHFYTFGAPILQDGFRPASPEQALRFAFDDGPEMLLQKSGGALPMGCHAFWKDGNWDFWKKYIEPDGLSEE